MFEVGDIIKNKFTGDKRVVLYIGEEFIGLSSPNTISRSRVGSVARWVKVGHISHVDKMMEVIKNNTR